MKLATPLLALALFTSCASPAAPPVATVDNVSGPHVHSNVAVFVIRGADTDALDFLTLDEGLKSGEVVVSEQGEGQVNQLVLDNRSRRPLFLQEGDRLKGGKQDRIIGSSLVVPPSSGARSVPAFCIEQGRWSSAADLRSQTFSVVGFPAAPSHEVRKAAKIANRQETVWKHVARTKDLSQDAIGIDISSTSLNEALDNPKLRAAIAAGTTALGSVLDAHPDAVGVAFAVNGVLLEVSIYPNRSLARRVYPRLLASYLLHGILEGVKPAAAPSCADIVAAMNEKAVGSGRTEHIDGANDMVVTEGPAMFRCITKYEGFEEHRQWLRK